MIRCRGPLGPSHPSRRLSLLVALAIVSLLLVSCQGGANTDPTATPPVVSEPPEQPVRFEPVVWTTGIDPGTGEPIDRVEAFPRDTVTIYAAVEVINLPDGATLSATWEINGRPVEGLQARIAVDRAQPAGRAEFHLDWNGRTLWPVGTLRIVITSSTGQSIEGSVWIE